MPITEGFTSRHSCVGPPKESFTEKRKKQKGMAYHEVLKFNPYRDEEGNYTTKERDAGGRGMAAGVKAKDVMRIANLQKHGPKMLARASQMAKSITTFEKAHRRANAAQAAGQPEVAKIFRDRAKALGAAVITGARRAARAAEAPVQPATTVKPAEKVHTGGGRPQQAQSAGATVPKAIATPKTPKPNPVRDKIKGLYGGYGDRTKPPTKTVDAKGRPHYTYPAKSVAQASGSTSGFKKGGPRASAADIAADKTKWTPGKSFAEHKASQNEATMKTLEGGPGKHVGVVPKTMEGGPGKSTGAVPINVSKPAVPKVADLAAKQKEIEAGMKAILGGKTFSYGGKTYGEVSPAAQPPKPAPPVPPKTAAPTAPVAPPKAAAPVTPPQTVTTAPNAGKRYKPTYDAQGYISGKSAPDAKDAKRIEDMVKGSLAGKGVDKEKLLRKAQTMANSITSADKAYRRAMAAENENYHGVAKIFYSRADALS